MGIVPDFISKIVAGVVELKKEKPLDFKKFTRLLSVFTFTYLGLITVVLLYVILVDRFSLYEIGNASFIIGAGVIILNLFVLVKTGVKDYDRGRVPQFRHTDSFRRERAQEKPVETVIFAIILASGCVMLTGYALLAFFG